MANIDTVSEQLETLVDKHGMEAIAAYLASMCREKADHIRTNWQDEMLARAWDMQGVTMERASKTAKKLGV